MKPTLLIVFVFLLISCKKENLALQNHLKGKWN
jgi:hypothetical protein